MKYVGRAGAGQLIKSSFIRVDLVHFWKLMSYDQCVNCDLLFSLFYKLHMPCQPSSNADVNHLFIFSLSILNSKLFPLLISGLLFSPNSHPAVLELHFHCNIYAAKINTLIHYSNVLSLLMETNPDSRSAHFWLINNFGCVSSVQEGWQAVWGRVHLR